MSLSGALAQSKGGLQVGPHCELRSATLVILLNNQRLTGKQKGQRPRAMQTIAMRDSTTVLQSVKRVSFFSGGRQLQIPPQTRAIKGHLFSKENYFSLILQS